MMFKRKQIITTLFWERFGATDDVFSYKMRSILEPQNPQNHDKNPRVGCGTESWNCTKLPTKDVLCLLGDFCHRAITRKESILFEWKSVFQGEEWWLCRCGSWLWQVAPDGFDSIPLIINDLTYVTYVQVWMFTVQFQGNDLLVLKCLEPKRLWILVVWSRFKPKKSDSESLRWHLERDQGNSTKLWQSESAGPGVLVPLQLWPFSCWCQSHCPVVRSSAADVRRERYRFSWFCRPMKYDLTKILPAYYQTSKAPD